MTKAVYVLGAGTNMVVRHRTRGVRPPLARDFFQQLHHGLSATELDRLRDENRELYEYIDRNWRHGYRDLSTKNFDLEECFTCLERDQRDASRRGEVAGAYYDMWRIKGQLTALFAGLLDEIASNQPPEDEGLRPLARHVLDESAAIVTFNYDTLFEQAMILESHQQWDPIPAYAAPFDLIESEGWGSWEEFDPTRFPAQVHTAPFLKMHGSLNWFRIAGGGQPVRDNSDIPVVRHAKYRQTLVRPVGSFTVASTTGDTFRMPDGTLLEQLIITPVLHKEVDESPFAEIWQKAKDEMCGCSRLVVCGYSFPRTDDATRRLFREAFANNRPEELTVINPDREVANLVKGICRFKGSPHTYDSLQEFIAHSES